MSTFRTPARLIAPKIPFQSSGEGMMRPVRARQDSPQVKTLMRGSRAAGAATRKISPLDDEIHDANRTHATVTTRVTTGIFLTHNGLSMLTNRLADREFH